MVEARIYRPSKTAMQSGKAKCRQWVLEFCPSDVDFIDPLMGWRGSKDTFHQIRLTFRSREAAVAYAQNKNLTVQVETPHYSLAAPKQYADNFRHDHVN